MLLEGLFVGFFQVGLVCFATDVFVVDNAINKLPTTSLYLELCGKLAMNLIDVVTFSPSRGLLLVVASTYLAKDGILNYFTNKTLHITDFSYHELSHNDSGLDIGCSSFIGDFSILNVSTADSLE